MTRRAAGRGLAALLVGAALAAFTLTRMRSTAPVPPSPANPSPENPSPAAPAVRAALHQHLRTIQERSEYRLRLDGVLDDTPAVIDAPVRFAYGRGPNDPLGFTLPAARFVSFQQYAGFVYGIRVAPQLGAAPPADALRALREAERAVDASAAWRKADGALDDAAVLRHAGGNAPPRELLVARWAAAGQTLTLSLKRTLASDPARPLYFASLAVDDAGDQRFEAYRAAMRARRRALGGAAGESLPVLRYWDDTTPPAPVRPGRRVSGRAAPWGAVALVLGSRGPACGRADGADVTTHPTVRAALGEALADVARHSTHDLSPQVRPGAALDLVTVAEPVAGPALSRRVRA